MSQVLACSFSTAEGPVSFHIEPWRHTPGHSRMWCVEIRVPETRLVAERLEKGIEEGSLRALKVESIFFASLEPGQFRMLAHNDSMSVLGIEVLKYMVTSGLLRGNEVVGKNVSLLFDLFTAEMQPRHAPTANAEQARAGAAERQAAVAEEKPLLN